MGKTARKTFGDVFEIRKPFQMGLHHFFIKMPPSSNATLPLDQSIRACLKIAFCQMYDSLSGKFISNKGGAAGCVDRIWCKYHAKWGVQMAGMNFQTRSRAAFAMYGYLQNEKGVATMCKIMEDMRNEAAQNKAKKQRFI